MMSNKPGPIALASLLALASAGIAIDTADAAGYLKLAGIKGESTDRQGEIDILSWSWGAASGGGCPQLSELSFTKNRDLSTGPLVDALNSRNPVPGILTETDSRGNPVFQLFLNDVLVVSYSTSSGDNGDTVESFGLQIASESGNTSVQGLISKVDSKGNVLSDSEFTVDPARCVP